MRISDWSSDVCSSDLDIEKSTCRDREEEQGRGPLSKWLWTQGSGGKPGHRQQRWLNAGRHPKRGKVKSRKLKIGLLWHSGKSGNLGVGALTIANMAIARQIAEELGFEPAFTIIGVADKGGAYVQPEEAQLYEVNSRRLLDPREAMTVIAWQDRKSTRLNSSH